MKNGKLSPVDVEEYKIEKLHQQYFILEALITLLSYGHQETQLNPPVATGLFFAFRQFSESLGELYPELLP